VTTTRSTGRPPWKQMARILIVDDEPAVLACVARQIALWGHTVVIVGSALAAAAMVASEEVDVLVSDLQMPFMDGFALAALAREARPELPVIIMIGSFASPGTKQPENFALVPKSAIPRALKVAVDRALARSNARRAGSRSHERSRV
jgi:DNA-binding NtrC family response regulator